MSETYKAVSRRASFVEDIRASGGGGQDILVGLVADETDGGDDPRITGCVAKN
ncbi:MAG TPA: hypothetical protein VIY29_24975 [Ktedonobacteraceae bacterium]